MDALLFGAGVLLSAMGAIFLKLGGTSMQSSGGISQWLWQAIKNPYVVIGFACYILPAFLWVHLLKKHPLSLVQPIIALTYALTPILAFLFLRESISPIRWIGIGVIILGIILVARS